MKVVASADFHGSFPEIPECDLLLIGGDVCPVNASHKPSGQKRWLRHHFAPWLAEQPAKHILWIAGNHDFVCESMVNFQYALPLLEEHAHYLKHGEVAEIEGLRVYGSPWTPNLKHWAFYASPEMFKEMGEKMPDHDICLIHSPPRYIVGLDGNHPDWTSPYILGAIERIQPKHVVCGHIHEGYGHRVVGDIEYWNVAHMDEDYNPVNAPREFEV